MKAAAAALAIVLATVSRADAACAVEAEELRGFLTKEVAHADKWDIAWGLAFGGVSTVQAAAAITKFKPGGDFNADDEATLYVGAAKSFIGFAAHTVTPIHAPLPARDPDPCVDLAHLRKTLAMLGKAERQTFWLTHLGGLAVNLAGGAILWHERSFKVGLISILISLPVGPLTAYTMPRAAWHRWRKDRASWTVGLGRTAGGDGLVVSLGGEL
jgi:hypothetical protein